MELLANIILSNFLFIFLVLTPPIKLRKWFFFYQQRLKDEILDLDDSANQVRQNKSQVESEIHTKKLSLMKCKDR